MRALVYIAYISVKLETFDLLNTRTLEPFSVPATHIRVDQDVHHKDITAILLVFFVRAQSCVWLTRHSE